MVSKRKKWTWFMYVMCVQVIFWTGAGLGAALSAYQSSSWGTLHNTTPLLCMLGGTCLVFGARLAQGCTRYSVMSICPKRFMIFYLTLCVFPYHPCIFSGHGLSGMALLCLPSFASVCAMFAGGIGTSLLLQSYHYEL